MNFDLLPYRTCRSSQGSPGGWFFFFFYKIEIDKYYLKIDDFLHLISISRFVVELHLDVVLQILLAVKFAFLCDKICRLIPKEDSLKKFGWLIYKYLTFQQLKKQVIEVWATKFFIKDKMTRRVHIVWLIFIKISKK